MSETLTEMSRNACSSHNKPHKQINVSLSVDVAYGSYSIYGVLAETEVASVNV